MNTQFFRQSVTCARPFVMNDLFVLKIKDFRLHGAVLLAFEQLALDNLSFSAVDCFYRCDFNLLWAINNLMILIVCM